MVKFFTEKIMAGEINPNTGEAWKVEDVPKLWKGRVAAEVWKVE